MDGWMPFAVLTYVTHRERQKDETALSAGAELMPEILRTVCSEEILTLCAPCGVLTLCAPRDVSKIMKSKSRLCQK